MHFMAFKGEPALPGRSQDPQTKLQVIGGAGRKEVSMLYL